MWFSESWDNFQLTIVHQYGPHSIPLWSKFNLKIDIFENWSLKNLYIDDVIDTW